MILLLVFVFGAHGVQKFRKSTAMADRLARDWHICAHNTEKMEKLKRLYLADRRKRNSCI